MISKLKKPEYFLQPLSILLRLLNKQKQGLSKTAFGKSIYTYPNDTMGRAIRKTGIYDIALTQLLWQLSKGATGILVDVGANIGYTSLVMHTAKPADIQLYSFEPNEEVVQILRKNHTLNGAKNEWKLIQAALSNYTGESHLQFPEGYNENHGIAILVQEDQEEGMRVKVLRLDDFFNGETVAIQLIKIDVEGHELQVLKGMERLLQERAIENIVYEDFSTGVGACQQYLETFGFRVFRVKKGWWGMRVEEPGSSAKTREPGWEEPNFWATRCSDKAIGRICAAGYSCI